MCNKEGKEMRQRESLGEKEDGRTGCPDGQRTRSRIVINLMKELWIDNSTFRFNSLRSSRWRQISLSLLYTSVNSILQSINQSICHLNDASALLSGLGIQDRWLISTLLFTLCDTTISLHRH